MKLYISGSLIAIVNVEHLVSVIENSNNNAIKFLIPHKITPGNLPHESFPLNVYTKCIEMMEQSDGCFVILDTYGRDSSWEMGWFKGRNKPIIGFVEKNTMFLQDWMVKGGLDAIITSSEMIYKVILKDPILKRKKLYKLSTLKELNDKILTIVGQTK